MSTVLRDRHVYVVGIGMHRYQRASSTSYVTLGLTALRESIADAGITWTDVDSAYVGAAKIGVAAAPTLLQYMGQTGVSAVQVESASASGSVAVRQAVLEVVSGMADVAVAVGVDKLDPPVDGVVKSGVAGIFDGLAQFHTMFALKTEHYLAERGAAPADLALFAVKNHRNGALNPYAQRRTVRTLEEVLAPPYVSGTLTRLQCTPNGEGAAALIVASEEAVRRLQIDRSRAVQVLASVHQSQPAVADRLPGENDEEAATRRASGAAFEQSGLAPGDLDLVELHDAFAVEEPMYLESMGICREGNAIDDVRRGRLDIGGRVAVSASGGLLAMGHPVGPTGVGQICEITRQLRNEATGRQHHGAVHGLAHMVGVGGVCTVHVLRAPATKGTRS